MKNKFLLAALCASAVAHAGAGQAAQAAAAPDASQQGASPAPSRQIPVQPAPQAWQVRQAAFAQAVTALAHDAANAQAKQQVEQALGDQAATPGAFTPMESLDMLGAYYLPRDGVEKIMPLIVKQAFLGWVDALQWGSPSAQEEIVVDQKLFSRAFRTRDGKKMIDAWMAIVRNDPPRATTIVDLGLRLGMADNLVQGQLTYDRRWPTAFGLERTSAANGGPPVLPALAAQMGYVQAQRLASARIKAFYLPVEQ